MTTGPTTPREGWFLMLGMGIALGSAMLLGALAFGYGLETLLEWTAP